MCSENIPIRAIIPFIHMEFHNPPENMWLFIWEQVVVPETKKLTIHEAPKHKETRMAELLSPKES